MLKLRNNNHKIRITDKDEWSWKLPKNSRKQFVIENMEKYIAWLTEVK